MSVILVHPAEAVGRNDTPLRGDTQKQHVLDGAYSTNVRCAHGYRLHHLYVPSCQQMLPDINRTSDCGPPFSWNSRRDNSL